MIGARAIKQRRRKHVFKFRIRKFHSNEWWFWSYRFLGAAVCYSACRLTWLFYFSCVKRKLNFSLKHRLSKNSSKQNCRIRMKMTKYTTMKWFIAVATAVKMLPNFHCDTATRLDVYTHSSVTLKRNYYDSLCT